MDDQKTHLNIDAGLCGKVTALAAGRATVALRTTTDMSADTMGLVHGGFVFGAADYAAMVAVNDPNVVLGSAETRFTAPVRAGDTVVLEATVTGEEGKKRIVSVAGKVEDREVFAGTFNAYVLDAHVLEG